VCVICMVFCSGACVWIDDKQQMLAGGVLVVIGRVFVAPAAVLMQSIAIQVALRQLLCAWCCMCACIWCLATVVQQCNVDCMHRQQRKGLRGRLSCECCIAQGCKGSFLC
jgi:hypothetical protein